MVSTGELVAAGIILVLASGIQRLTGMGLALMGSPLLVLALGTATGVQTIQMVGLVVCATSAAALFRDINPSRAMVLSLSAIVGLVPGALVARHLPSAWLMILLGSITLAAIGLIPRLARTSFLDGRRGTVIAGALSGFMNITAGVGGPPMVVYAQTTRWAYPEYVATVQLYFTVLNLASLVGRGLPHLPRLGWIIVAAASFVGLGLGQVLDGRISEHRCRQLVVALATVGAAVAVIRGVLAL